MVKQIQLVKEMKEKWEALGIDALIMPNYPHPAFKSSSVDQVGSIRDYQLLWSVLHYPAGVVPVTTVSAQDKEQAYEDGGYNDMWSRAISKEVSEMTLGMPVGVQVVSSKWEDEIALGVMKAIDRQLKPEISPPINLVN